MPNQTQQALWHLEMTRHSLDEWTETTFSLRLRFHSTEMTSDEQHERRLINAVLFSNFDLKVSTTASLFVTFGQQKYWHREMAGNGATTEDINPL